MRNGRSHMHTPHGDIHDVGLQDGCERCAEHAETPHISLDSGAFEDLVVRTLRNRFGGHYTRDGVEVDSPFGDHVQPRSETEARAMAVVMTQLERTGKYFELAGMSVALYLAERWRVHARYHLVS